MKSAELSEQLRLSVIFPAKAKILAGENEVVLVRSNYRFLGEGQRSLGDWLAMARTAGVSFEELLCYLVRDVMGDSFSVEFRRNSGYLGVTSDSLYVLVRTTV